MKSNASFGLHDNNVHTLLVNRGTANEQIAFQIIQEDLVTAKETFWKR